MGAAKSSNTASAFVGVSNFVANSTNATTSQVNNDVNSIVLKHCNIEAGQDVNIGAKTKISIQNSQIAAAKQDANVQNNIAQKMLQTATSTVGSMGVGYAEASNNVSVACNVSNDVMNTMSTSAGQFAGVTNSFVCNDSTIKAGGNVGISFTNETDFLSSQVQNNQQVAKVINDISQTVEQKATATVEGAWMVLIAIAVIIAAVGYGVSKTAAAIAGPAKIALTFGVIIFITMIILFMYVRDNPPLFGKPERCLAHSMIGLGSGADQQSCTDYVSGDSMALSSPVTKYLFPILPSNSPQNLGNLLQMSISAASGQNQGGDNAKMGTNSGYRADAYETLKNAIIQITTDFPCPDGSVPPNPLVVLKDSDAKYYKIPKQWISLPANSDTTDKNIGTCIGAVQIKDGAPKIDGITCPLYIDPANVPSGITLDRTSAAEMAIANLNLNAWTTYLSSGSNAKNNMLRSLYARFVLLTIINAQIDMNIYVDENEYVSFGNNIMLAKDAKKLIDPSTKGCPVYLFTPTNLNQNWNNGQTGSGSLTGDIGTVNSSMYILQKGIHKNKLYIIIGIGLFLSLIFVSMFRSSGDEKGEKGK